MSNGDLTERGACLNGDPLPWLLEESNPCVRYRTLTELLGRPADDPEVRSTVEAIPDYSPAGAMLSALDEMEPFPEGTVWSMPLFKKNLGDLDTLHRFGIPGGHPVIQRACDQWLDVELFPHAECYPMPSPFPLPRRPVLRAGPFEVSSHPTCGRRREAAAQEGVLAPPLADSSQEVA